MKMVGLVKFIKGGGMNDFIGNELNVGDDVIFCGYDGFLEGVVTDMKNNLVYVDKSVLGVWPDELIKVIRQ